jgi:hypothetical protein
MKLPACVSAIGLGIGLALTPLGVSAQNTVTITTSLALDNTQMGGMSTNDYCTNLVLVIYSSKNITTPTNLWPVVQVTPCSQLLPQGLPPTPWTNALAIDNSTRFYSAQVTNYNNEAGPFFPVWVYLRGGPNGTLTVRRQ